MKSETLFTYKGRIYVRPCGRGITLEDDPQERHLDEVLDSDYYYAEITIKSKQPDENQTKRNLQGR